MKLAKTGRVHKLHYLKLLIALPSNLVLTTELNT